MAVATWWREGEMSERGKLRNTCDFPDRTRKCVVPQRTLGRSVSAMVQLRAHSRCGLGRTRMQSSPSATFHSLIESLQREHAPLDTSANDTTPARPL